MSLFKSSFLVAIFMFLATTGWAQSLFGEVDVRSGRESDVDVVYVIDELNCVVSPPQRFSVSRKPKHGSVRLELSRYTTGPEAKRCANRPVKAVRIYYTSDRGYRGQDDFTVLIGFPAVDGNPNVRRGGSFRYRVSVK